MKHLCTCRGWRLFPRFPDVCLPTWLRVLPRHNELFIERWNKRGEFLKMFCKIWFYKITNLLWNLIILQTFSVRNIKGKRQVIVSVLRIYPGYSFEGTTISIWSIECWKIAAALLGQIPFDSVTYRRDGPLSRFGERMFRFAQLFIERGWMVTFVQSFLW